MTIVIYCEGETERKVLPRLQKYFQQKIRAGRPQVRIDVQTFNGVGQYLVKIGPAVRNRVEVEHDRVVFGLIDYYGCGLQLVKQHWGDLDTLGRRVNHLKNLIQTRIPDEYRSNMHQHFAVHEIEAWILADEEPLRSRLGDERVGPWPQPELINLDHPPAKRISELFQRKLRQAYQKTIDGEVLLRGANPDQIYDKCSYFRELMDDLMLACDEEAPARPQRRPKSR